MQNRRRRGLSIAEDQQPDEIKKGSQDEISQAWKKAHKDFRNGNHEPLENMFHAFGQIHESVVRSKGPFTQKGKIPDFNEIDVFLIGVTLTSLTFIIHPLFFTLLIGIPIKAVHLRYKQSKGYDKSKKLFIYKVAMELHYYTWGVLIPGYYFTSIEGMSLSLGDAGTTAQIILEFSKLIVGG